MYTYDTDLDLLVFRPTGAMDLMMVKNYYLLISELKPAACSRRLVNLDLLERIDFGYDDLTAIEGMARGANLGQAASITIVLLASRSLAVGIANMVQRVMSRPGYDIAVLGTIDEAARHLDVSPTLLQG